MAGVVTRFAGAALGAVIIGCSASTVPPTPTGSPAQPGATDLPTPAESLGPLPVESPLAGPIEISPSAVLLTGAGQSARLTATAFGVDGVAVPVTWSSSDPAQVSVDENGNVTAVAELGSALIFADAGDRSSSVAVLVAEPAPGAVLVHDSDVVGEPQRLGDPNAMPANGDRYRVTLTDTEPPVAGTILLATGSAEVAGRVITATAGATGTDVEYELVPLPELFARYSMDLDVPIDLPDELEDDSPPVAEGSATAAVARPNTGEVPGRLAIEHKAEKEADFEKGPLKCKVSVAAKFKSSEFSITAKTDLTLQVEGRKTKADPPTPEHTKVVLTGPVALDVRGGLKAEAGFEGKAECELKTHIPIPLGGVLAVVLAVTVPIGLSASAEGKVTAVTVDVGPAGHLGTTVTVGFQCDPSACWAIKEHTPDQNNGVTWNSKVEIVRDSRVEASMALNVVTGLGLKVGTTAYSIVDAKIGPVQSFNLAFDDAQIRDQAYASNYDLRVIGSVTPGDDLKTLISRMFGGAVNLDLGANYKSDPLDESPKGKLTADKARVQVDKPVRLVIDLTPDTMNYFNLIPNVDFLRISRWKDGVLYPLQDLSFTASGQTRFEWTWTPGEEFLGMNELVAFVYSYAVPLVPLEIAPDSTAQVEVVDACLAEPPTPPPPPQPGQPPTVAPPAPSEPPEDPCAADLTITLERDYDELLIDEKWEISGDLELLEDAILLPDQLEGDYVGVGEYSGGSNRVDCPTDARPPELLSGQGRVWLAANVADDGGVFDAALAGKRILVISVLPIVADLIANPDNPAPGALIGYVPIEGGTHTTAERWTDGFLTCGVLGEKRLTITLQPSAINP